MIEFESINDLPKDFTGVCKVTNTNAIYHVKDGAIHNENGPAVILKDGTKYWCINNKYHRKDGAACEYSNGDKIWFYKGKSYGHDDQFTNETWEEKIRELKLEIFK